MASSRCAILSVCGKESADQTVHFSELTLLEAVTDRKNAGVEVRVMLNPKAQAATVPMMTPSITSRRMA